MNGETMALVRGDKLFLVTDSTGQIEQTKRWTDTVLSTWGFEDHEPKVLGKWRIPDYEEGDLVQRYNEWDIDPTGRWLAYTKDNTVCIRSIERLNNSPERMIGQHSSKTTAVIFHPNLDVLVSADSSGKILFWPFTANPAKKFRELDVKTSVLDLFFDE